MNDITSKEAIEILSHYTDLGYGIVIEGEDTSKIKQALSFASKTLANATPQGEWKYIGGDEWVCPECGHVITTEGSWENPLSTGAYHCENCGADMRGGAE